METKYLLSRKFKPLGWLLFLIGFTLGIAVLFGGL